MQSVLIEAVAFDMDGLLLNTEDLYEVVGNQLMERRGRTFRDEVRQQMIGKPAEQAYNAMIRAENLTDTWQALDAEAHSIFEELLPKRLAVMDGVYELMDFLDARGIRRCVATSSTRAFAKRALAMVNLWERVDFVLTAEEVERGKPHPDIYIEAAKRLNREIHRVLVLEDSPTGTKAGASAGAYVVSVPNVHTRKGSFQGCQWIADTLKDRRIYELLKE